MLSLPSKAKPAFLFPSPTGRLEEYLGSMAKIQKAVEYFQDNSPDSPELNKVVRNV
jgi:exocyst complex protein 7